MGVSLRIGVSLALAPFVLAALTGFVHAQTVTAPSQPTSTSPLAPEAADAANPVAYCADLQRVIALALTKERFATIAGKSRDGNFLATSLPLTGWKDCSLYGLRTYTCDSRDLGSAEEGASSQTAIVEEIKGCLGESWSEDQDRSSSTYVVLRSSHGPVSMTISTSPNETNGYVVRLTMFLRTGG